MKESAAWADLRVALVAAAGERRKAIHICRIENMVGVGVFDTNFSWSGTECWLEGKYLSEFPVKPTTLVKFGFSGEQEMWATRRLLTGGLLYLWAKIGLSDWGRGRGWYLIKLDSVEMIRECKAGIRQELLKIKRFDTASQLTCSLFNELSHHRSYLA